MKLILIRHGKTVANSQKVYNPHDDALTVEGEAQVLAAKKYFGTLLYDKAFVSSLGRARKTAELLELHDVAVDARLRDHEMGALTGTPWGSFTAYCKAMPGPPEECVPPGGESNEQVTARVHDFLRELGEGTFVIVSHSAVFARIVQHYARTQFNFEDLHFENAALWTVENGDVMHENWVPWREILK